MINQIFSIKKVSSNQSNRAIKYSLIQIQYKQKYLINKNIIYYPYRHDYQDQGWGCAWRAIQTMLSTIDIQIDFKQLYDKFSKKQILIQQSLKIYSQNVIQQLVKTKFAPEQLSSHWAQPFICSLVFKYFQKQPKLLLLNSYPKAYAPKVVFKQIITFQKLIYLIEQNILKTSFMIDDGQFALSIIGFRRRQNQQYELLFADPHIKCNRQHNSVGIYSKIFDKFGTPLRYSTRKKQQIQQSLYDVYDKLIFKQKGWMIAYL